MLIQDSNEQRKYFFQIEDIKLFWNNYNYVISMYHVQEPCLSPTNSKLKYTKYQLHKLAQ